MSGAANTILLASSSPRRVQLLQQLGLDFTQKHVDIDEKVLASESPAQYVKRLSHEKILAVKSLHDTDKQFDIILSADTCIACDGRILGKPATMEQAREYLRLLSGRQHSVYSAVCVAWNQRHDIRLSTSHVEMAVINEQEIIDYCNTGEPLDKAGAYAIQGLAAVFIKSIQGSYSGIMGLPLFETAELLQTAGIKLFKRAL